MLILCKANLILSWFAKYFIVAGTVANQEPIFAITNTKLYVPPVTLLTQWKTIKIIEIRF